ncbi:TetR/AcrR family transcriptional regulator [Streptomyces sp. SID13031]|uniref:TetR/AcrR family transcriptional regulator n=1 Tax=Streptomyces sp. SID13031 TaxID=2706046 RepID=UPI0013CD8D8D|nr:TetR/AcrR family transcriptional regulator [Streptomyces sp. SID13031]NEA32487.1 TetR/AcrR family transcriptional regulator [Streptomyces sp. SID13031]
MINLLWGDPPPPTRGPKPAMTVEGITTAAITIADRDGLDAVSMQRVAAELSFTKMALYRYVPGKAELVSLMTDRAMGVPPHHPPQPWRQALMDWALDLYAAFERHPWLLLSTVGRRALGPNELTWMDFGVRALMETGLNGGQQLDALMTIAGQVRTLAHQTLTLTGGTVGMSEENLTSALAEILASQPDRFPGLATAMKSVEGSQNQGLTFGLERFLDGLELLIKRG